MQRTIIRLAESVSAAPISARSVSQQLLPPLVLYRRLLRCHRKNLPIEMRVLGDDYVKAEFRRTRKTDNPVHIIGFLGEWKSYLDQIESQGIPQEQKGKQLDRDLLERMSPEQIGQLYELMLAARGGEMTEEQAEKQIEETLTDMGIPTEANSGASSANGGKKS